MASKKKNTAQALPIRGRKSATPRAPRKIVSAAGQQVSGMRRDLLRYVDFPPAIITLVAFAIVAIVGVIYLSQVTAVTNANYTLQSLQSDHTALMRERENLQLQIARSQSLANIEKIASGRLHMVPIGDKYRYLVIAPGLLQGYSPEQASPETGTTQPPGDQSSARSGPNTNSNP
jgi:cell division protein FtsL